MQDLLAAAGVGKSKTEPVIQEMGHHRRRLRLGRRGLDALYQDYLRPGAHRIYFDHGTETLDASYEAFQRQVDEVMRAAGYREGEDWLTRRFPGAEHSERAWRERVHIPLLFLLEGQSA